VRRPVIATVVLALLCIAFGVSVLAVELYSYPTYFGKKWYDLDATGKVNLNYYAADLLADYNKNDPAVGDYGIDSDELEDAHDIWAVPVSPASPNGRVNVIPQTSLGQYQIRHVVIDDEEEWYDLLETPFENGEGVVFVK
jgi:hypothetical protein